MDLHLTPEHIHDQLFRASYAKRELDAAQDRALDILRGFSRRGMLGRVDLVLHQGVMTWFRGMFNGEILAMSQGGESPSRHYNGNVNSDIYRWIYDEVVRRGLLCDRSGKITSSTKQNPYDLYDECWVLLDNYHHFLMRLIEFIPQPVILSYRRAGKADRRQTYTSLLTGLQSYLRAYEKDPETRAEIWPADEWLARRGWSMLGDGGTPTIEAGRFVSLCWEPTLTPKDVRTEETLKAFFERQDAL